MTELTCRLFNMGHWFVLCDKIDLKHCALCGKLGEQKEIYGNILHTTGYKEPDARITKRRTIQGKDT